MTDRNRVLVDVDDTISETQHVLIREVNRRLGTNFTFKEMTRAHREKEIPAWGEGVREVLSDPDTMLTCQPSCGALEALKSLCKAGFEAHIVSSRQEPLHDATAAWLKLHGFADHVSHIHPRSGSEGGTDFKVRIAREQNFVAAFDDTFEVAVALADVVPLVHLIDKPWNRGHDEELPDNVVRVDDFASGVDEFLRYPCPCIYDPPCEGCPWDNTSTR